MKDTEEIRVGQPSSIIPDQAITYLIVSVFGVFFLLFLILPLVQILRTSFVSEAHFTFRNYIEYFGKSRILRL